MSSPVPTADPDYSRRVLEELYTYRRRRAGVAWLLWATLGWMGVHRFYLGREFTGLAMLFTGGGGLLWWGVDAFLLGGMVEGYNREQTRREAEGLPPLGLDCMPPLEGDALGTGPPWLDAWRARSSWSRKIRFGGDLLVLLVAGAALGTMADVDGGLEALVAVLVLISVTALGAGPDWLDDVPGLAHLQRWSHRLRLFYHQNRPGSPPLLLLRPVVGMLWAPFRARDRTEVRLYVELGAAFTAGFLLLDLVPELLVPLLSPGESVSLSSLVTGWIGEVMTTFFLTYAFAAPVGAVLTLYLLLRPTHAVPRLLSAFTVGAIVLGVVTGG